MNWYEFLTMDPGFLHGNLNSFVDRKSVGKSGIILILWKFYQLCKIKYQNLIKFQKRVINWNNWNQKIFYLITDWRFLIKILMKFNETEII
jgi:hypothetical protein